MVVMMMSLVVLSVMLVVMSVMMRRTHMSGQSGEESVRAHHAVTAGSSAYTAATAATISTGNLMAAIPMRRQVHCCAIVTDRQAHYIQQSTIDNTYLIKHCLAMTELH